MRPVASWGMVAATGGRYRVLAQLGETTLSKRGRAPGLWHLGKPASLDDELRRTLAVANTVIAWALLAVVVPIILVLAFLAPNTFALALTIAVILAGATLLAFMLNRAAHPVAASVLLGMSCWMLFSVAAWYSGGLTSPNLVALILVAGFAGLTLGARGSLPAAAFGVVTTLVFVYAENHHLLPPSAVAGRPWILGSAYIAYFVIIGFLEAVLAVNIGATRDRANREADKRLLAEQRLRDVVDNAPFGAFVCELTKQGSLLVVHVNHAASVVLGAEAGQFIGSSIEEAFSALSSGQLLSKFKEIAKGGGSMHSESVPYFAEGKSGTLEVHAFQIGANSMAIFFSDVTERRREQVQIHNAAFHDELTKLPNRKLLLDRLTMALAGANRRHTEVALFFIDLDNFKPINDRFGHAFGDELLIGVGARLTSCARASDTVARFGGDEFTLLMPDVNNRDEVDLVARKLISCLTEPLEIHNQMIEITASIGVSVTGQDGVSPDNLLEHADIAMYRVKRAGRNGYHIY